MPVSVSHSNVLTRNADLWLAAGLTVAGIYFFSGRFTTVRFDRESIEVRVERGLIQVTGLYHYANRSRLPAVLFRLRLPRCFSLVSSNYALTDLPDAGRGSIYSFSKTDFYPDHDWEYTWEESHGCVASHRGDPQ